MKMNGGSVVVERTDGVIRISGFASSCANPTLSYNPRDRDFAAVSGPRKGRPVFRSGNPKMMLGLLGTQ